MEETKPKPRITHIVEGTINRLMEMEPRQCMICGGILKPVLIYKSGKEEQFSKCVLCNYYDLLAKCLPPFWPRYRSASIKQFPEKIQDKFKNFPEGKISSVVIFGDVGRGKTHLAFALIRQYVENKIKPFPETISLPKIEILTTDEIIVNLKNIYKKWDDWDFLKTRAGIFFIDGLGDRFYQDARYVDEIIDYLYRNCFSFIITTNLIPEKIAEHYGERVMSRLIESSLLFELKGEDRRCTK